MSSVTDDTISLRGAGVVSIAQQKKGHRFTLDSILLADFCRIRPRDSILEPGTGTGIVSILLAKKFPTVRITAVELQLPAARLAVRNIADNGLDGRVDLLNEDINALKQTLKAGSFNVIVANPPYTKTGTGEKSPLRTRNIARQDPAGGTGVWLDLHVFLKNKGRYFLVFPADRHAELIASLQSRKLTPKRMRLVHAFADKPASLVLMEAVKSAGTGIEVLPPLVVHDTGGKYTEEIMNIYDMSSDT